MRCFVLDAKINKESKGYQYVEKVMSTQADKLKPVMGGKFIQALEKFHGKENTVKATKWLFNQNDASFKGVKEFKDRLINALAGETHLSGEDQKYIADVTHRVASKILA